MNREERTINLIDLILTIAAKWRLLLLLFVIAGATAIGSSWIESQKNSGQMVQKPEVSAESFVNVQVYEKYKELVEKQETYISESPIMQLDGNGFYVGVLSYYVDNHYTVTSPEVDKYNNVASIVQAYLVQLKEDKVREKLVEILGWEASQTEFVWDMVDTGDNFQLYGQTDENQKDEANIIVLVYANEKEKCQGMLAVLAEQITSLRAGIAETYGVHDLIAVNQNCVKTTSNALIQYQNEAIVKLDGMQTMLSKRENALTESELAYINYDENIESQRTVESAQISINWKKTILAAVIGVVLGCCWIVMRYIFTDLVRSRGDIESYNIKNMGTMYLGEVKRKLFLDKWIKTLQNKQLGSVSSQELLECILTNIIISAEKENLGKIAVSGSENSMREEDFSYLKDCAEEKGVELIKVEAFVKNASAMRKIHDTQSVLLVETYGLTRNKTLNEEIIWCKENDIHLLGVVMMSR